MSSKPHNARCQCDECRAWARKVFAAPIAGAELARAIKPELAAATAYPERPHPSPCDCTSCQQWARQIVAMAPPPTIHVRPREATPAPRPCGRTREQFCLCDLCIADHAARRRTA